MIRIDIAPFLKNLADAVLHRFGFHIFDAWKEYNFLTVNLILYPLKIYAIETDFLNRYCVKIVAQISKR